MKGYPSKRDFAKTIYVPKQRGLAKTLTADQRSRLSLALQAMQMEGNNDTLYGVCHPAGRSGEIDFYQEPTTELVKPRLTAMLQAYRLGASHVADIAPLHSAITTAANLLDDLRGDSGADPRNAAAQAMRYHFVLLPILHNIAR